MVLKLLLIEMKLVKTSQHIHQDEYLRRCFFVDLHKEVMLLSDLQNYQLVILIYLCCLLNICLLKFPLLANINFFRDRLNK